MPVATVAVAQGADETRRAFHGFQRGSIKRPPGWRAKKPEKPVRPAIGCCSSSSTTVAASQQKRVMPTPSE